MWISSCEIFSTRDLMATYKFSLYIDGIRSSFSVTSNEASTHSFSYEKIYNKFNFSKAFSSNGCIGFYCCFRILSSRYKLRDT